MQNNRYDMRPETPGQIPGRWTVFDIFTGMPAEINDVPQVGLDMDEADDLVDLLNRLYAERRDGPVQ